MAITTSFLEELIDKHGPWAYHITDGGFRVMPSILEQGLLPLADPADNRFDDACLPRPNHVYLCVGEGLYGIMDQMCFDRDEFITSVVAIDLRHLDPALINPDEDGCAGYFLGKPPVLMPGAEKACNTVRCALLTSDEGACDFVNRPYATYGEWADAIDLGSDLDHTRECIETFGTLAYRGAIPASALRVATEDELRPLMQRPVVA